MIVSINQPAYLPWLGYFDRIQRSDVHVVLDHVQFEKNSMVNRNRIRTANGVEMVTVPLKTAGRFGDLAIREVQIASDGKWPRKHWQTIRQGYGHAQYFDSHEGFFSEIYRQQWDTLADLLHQVTTYLLNALGIKTRMLFSSHMGVQGKKRDLILNILRSVGAKTYISGPFGRGYLDPRIFETEGIGLMFHDYVHPSYPQCFPGFEPCLSVIDLLFNCGPDSLRILSNRMPDALIRARSVGD